MTVALPVRTDRPAYRPYLTRVAAIEQLGPHFTRVVLTGDDLSTFGTDGLDQRIKLVFPLADGTLPDLIDDHSWYERWLALPDERRNPIRTYTVRRIDPVARLLTVDLVRHPPAAGGALGPAAQWLEQVRVGGELVVVGPDARSIHSGVGLDWHPGQAHSLLLAGDETAVPAICAILESLPGDRHVQAFLEVPATADVQQLDVPDHFDVTWLPRDGRPSGEALRPAVTRWLEAHPELIAQAAAPRPQVVEEIDVDSEILWDSPEVVLPGEFYAWLAGESGLIKTLRRDLVSGRGIDRRRVAFMGYWRTGRSEGS